MRRKEKAVYVCTMVFHVTSTSYFMVCIHAALWHINNNDTALCALASSENYTQKLACSQGPLTSNNCLDYYYKYLSGFWRHAEWWYRVYFFQCIPTSLGPLLLDRVLLF